MRATEFTLTHCFVWLRYDVDFTPAQLALDQLVDDEARQLATQRQRDEAMRVAVGGDETQMNVEAGRPSATSARTALPLPEPQPEPEQQLEPERPMNGLPRTASGASAQTAAADLSAAMVCTTEQFFVGAFGHHSSNFRAVSVSVTG